MSVLETNNLTRTYGSRRGVRDVNLVLEKGEVFGFLGPNGAGKSTTIRLLLGFLKPSSGSATILGQDCWAASAAIKREVGYVAGDVRLYPWMTANNALQIAGEIRNRDLTAEGGRLAERFHLEPDLPVRKMSRGNRQKLALVLALAPRPALIILDEPTSGLDPLIQDALADQLQELAKEGHTVMFSSHTLSEVESLCDRVAIIRNGQIVADEGLDSLKARAPREFAVTFDSSEAAAGCAVPDGVRLVNRDNEQLLLRVTGTPVETMRWAATLPIVDITISPPDLESIFREYYDDTEAPS